MSTMPRFCAHLGYLFTEVPLEERFAAAASAGFVAVEHPAPYDFGPERFGSLAAQNGLSVAQISAPSGNAKAGEKGFACLADRKDDFQRSVRQGIEAARAVGTNLLHVMPGILPAGHAREQLRDTYVSNLKWAADECQRAHLTVLIEPISDETITGFYVNHPDFAIALLDDIDAGNARLMFDVYHAAVKELDPVAFVQANLERIAHIQIADYPGRHEPGSGRVQFSRFFEELDSLNFEGLVGCEYKPATNTQQGLHWLETHLTN